MLFLRYYTLVLSLLLFMATKPVSGQEFISPEEFYYGIEKGIFFDLVIDVRTQEEWDEGHIETATFVENLATMDSVPSDLENCESSCVIVVYCRSGNRAAAAIELLLENGYSGTIYNGQGVSQWTEAGYELVDTASVDANCAAPVEEEDCPKPPFSNDGGAPCLSGDSTVQVVLVDKNNNGKHSTARKIKDLQVGDSILTGDDKMEQVYMFGHDNAYAVATFLRIEIEQSTTTTTLANKATEVLELSKEHLLFKHKVAQPVPSATLKVGDFILWNGTTAKQVTSIQHVQKRGIHSPIVPSGTFLAGHGILVSSYTTVGTSNNNNINESALFQFGPAIAIAYHWLTHVVLSPFRVLCRSSTMMINNSAVAVCNQKNAEGQVLFVSVGEKILLSHFQNDGRMLHIMIGMVFCILIVPTYGLEHVFLMLNDFTTITVWVLLWVTCGLSLYRLSRDQKTRAKISGPATAA